MTEQNYRIRIKLGEVEIEAEGDKEFVEKYIEEFKKEMPKIAKELPPKEKIISPEIQKEEVDLGKLSLAEFYKQKQPKDHDEKVVVFAYWLTRKEKKEESALFQPIIFRLLRIIDCMLIYHRVTSLASHRAERLTRVST